MLDTAHNSIDLAPIATTTNAAPAFALEVEREAIMRARAARDRIDTLLLDRPAAARNRVDRLLGITSHARHFAASKPAALTSEDIVSVGPTSSARARVAALLSPAA